MSKTFLKISQIILAFLIFLIPVFVWPFTNDFFAFPKVNLFIFGTLIAFLFWLASQLSAKKIEIKSNFLYYPLFLILLANIISFFVNWGGIEKFIAFWVFLPFFGFLLFSFVLTSVFDQKNDLVNYLLLGSGAIISCLGIWLFLLPQTKYPLSLNIFGFPLLITNSSFSPSGGSLNSALFLLSLIPFLTFNFQKLFKKEKEGGFWLKIIGEFLVTLIIITGLGVFVFQSISINKPVILPYLIGWAIAVENLKYPVNGLFGIGPGHFFNAFTRLKPLAYNYSNFWNNRFFYSSNEIFQIITTLGLVGLATYFYLVLKFIKTSKKTPEFWSAGIIFLSMIASPANFLLYFLLIVYLTLLFNKKAGKTYPLGKQAAAALGISFFLIIFAIFYFLGRNLASEIAFQKSLIAAGQNRGADTYNLQIKAINLNPYRSDFHQVYSQTNLALANSLTGQKNLSDQDKQTIAQLVQQAIREGRNAVALAPQNVLVWENLANIYRQLIYFAQGAEDWAIASANQAMRLDPNNPNQYLNLGGLYYSLKRFDDAASLFQTSVNLKTDFANGWYNLAAAYKEKGEWQKALDALNQTSRFVTVDSPDWEKVQKEIGEIKNKLPKAEEKTTKGKETLKLPEPLPSPKPEITPIELPPAQEATDTP